MLEIKNLTKTYKGGKKAVSNLSLHISDGDIFGFIGHNGAGKTTTIKAVVGALDFDSGEITVDGKSIVASPVECKKIMAYIPDNPDVYEYLTGIQYLNFTADIYGVSSEERSRLIAKYGDAFELTPSLGDLVSSYSHGMKQKLAIISALIHSPRLLVLDEPFVGLDPKAAHEFKQIMHEITEKGGAVFFSTHVLDVAERLCNRIAIIKNGSLVTCGDVSEFTRDGRSLEEVFLESLGKEED